MLLHTRDFHMRAIRTHDVSPRTVSVSIRTASSGSALVCSSMNAVSVLGNLFTLLLSSVAVWLRVGLDQRSLIYVIC